MIKKSLVSVIIIGLSGLVLAGCTPNANTVAPTPTKTVQQAPTASPNPTSTPSSTPTTEPTPVVPEKDTVITTVIISADDILFENKAGEIIKESSYFENPAAAITNLTEAFGVEPVIEYSGEQKCWYHMTDAKWPSFQLSYEGQDPNATPERNFTVMSLEPSTDITVASLNGAHIGDSLTDYLTKIPESNPRVVYDIPNETDPNSQKYTLVTDEKTDKNPYSDMTNQPEEYANRYGTIVTAEGDTITSIIAPRDLYYDC
jgi:hypothetical protein